MVPPSNCDPPPRTVPSPQVWWFGSIGKIPSPQVGGSGKVNYEAGILPPFPNNRKTPKSTNNTQGPARGKEGFVRFLDELTVMVHGGFAPWNCCYDKERSVTTLPLQR